VRAESGLDQGESEMILCCGGRGRGEGITPLLIILWIGCLNGTKALHSGVKGQHFDNNRHGQTADEHRDTFRDW
jgi:hypothetical protein